MNTACELLTKSEKIALIVDCALRRDKHPTKCTSHLTKGNTSTGFKDFHLHRVYAEIPLEIMQNYHEASADVFPMLFANHSVLIQACNFDAAAFKRDSASAKTSG